MMPFAFSLASSIGGRGMILCGQKIWHKKASCNDFSHLLLLLRFSLVFPRARAFFHHLFSFFYFIRYFLQDKYNVTTTMRNDYKMLNFSENPERNGHTEAFKCTR